MSYILENNNTRFQEDNKVSIVGKLIDVNLQDRTDRNGKTALTGSVRIRVPQPINGREEVEEIEIRPYVSQLTAKNQQNPMYDNVKALMTAKTINAVGEAAADTVRLRNASLNENMYMDNQGVFRDTWVVRPSFINIDNSLTPNAAFSVKAVVLAYNPEIVNDEETGRLAVDLGIVGYGNPVPVIHKIRFYAENPEIINGIEQYWQINDVIIAEGKIRCTTIETTKQAMSQDGGFGAETVDIDSTTSRSVRELIITHGKPPVDEDFRYSDEDYRMLCQARKARVEQVQMNRAPAAATRTTVTRRGFED